MPSIDSLEAAERYSAPAAVFWESALRGPERAAWVDAVDGRVRSWRHLAASVVPLVDEMRGRGVAPGARIASWLPNGLDWVRLELALQTLGAIHVGLDARLAPAAAGRLIDDCGARAVVAAGRARRLDAAAARWDDVLQAGERGSSAEPEADDYERMLRLGAAVPATAPRAILYTSGTTGGPKGVVLSGRNLMTNAAAKLGAAPQRADDVRLNFLPLAHAYARTCELGTWLLSRSVLAVAESIEAWMRIAPRVRPTLANGVPHFWQRLRERSLAHEGGFGALTGGRLRLAGVGGAALPPELHRWLRRQGVVPIQGYGLTEASPVVCSATPADARPGAVGRPVAGVEVRLDREGELWCRGPGVMLGYWNDPSRTAERIRDGWLRTGDLAEIEADGQLRVLGRADDVIVLSTGRKVAPLGIELELLGDPLIAQAVVVGTGRPALTALLWLDRAATLSDEELRRRIDARLAARPRHERPAHLVRLARPLSFEAGELTAKGTVRRSALEQAARG